MTHPPRESSSKKERDIVQPREIKRKPCEEQRGRGRGGHDTPDNMVQVQGKKMGEKKRFEEQRNGRGDGGTI
jgi:hypothetical protein